MTINVVNLDALIPRADFAVDDTPVRATPRDRITISDWMDTILYLTSGSRTSNGKLFIGAQ